MVLMMKIMMILLITYPFLFYYYFLFGFFGNGELFISVQGLCEAV